MAADHAAVAADNDAPLFVDTHAHLQWPALQAEIDAVLARARESGVGRVLTLGTELESCRAAIAIAEQYDGVYAAVGLHPGDVPADLEHAVEAVSALLAHPKVVAIGETGLDYFHKDNPPRDLQIASFERHLELAELTGKPVSIHNREATGDVMRLLERFAGRVTPILHCYTGDEETARAAIELGCYISFAGNCTYPKLGAVLEASATVPLDRLLIETDAPFLAPREQRGRRNEPAYILQTYDAVARARGVSRRDLGRTVAANAERLFGWEHVLAQGSEGAA